MSGRIVALELQYDSMPDGVWIDRHADYRNLGVVDVWLWHPHAGVPGIVHDHGLPGWLYGENHHELHALVAYGHRPRPHRWWEDNDLAQFFPHWPAHPADRTYREPIDLRRLQLTEGGIGLPADLAQRWVDEQASAITNAVAASASATVQEPATPTGLQMRPPVSPDALRLLPPATLERPALRFDSTRQSPQQRQSTVIRIDAQPPHRDVPERRRYLCRACVSKIFGTAELYKHASCATTLRPS